MSNYYFFNPYDIQTKGIEGPYDEQIALLKKEIEESEALIIGAGAGLSTAAGFVYGGRRFKQYFFDYIEKYGFRDMYSGGFGPFEDLEEHWAYWTRYIYINRYLNPPKPVYEDLFSLVKDKDYFVVTTNVDHCFQKAGFDKNRLFYTQGDFGLFQCSDGHLQKTYENEEWVMNALEVQGFIKDENGIYHVPDDGTLKMRLPSELIPKCPDDGSEVSMNLRADDTFVEDEGWIAACERYNEFCKKHAGMRVLYLELGVGMNTPGIIKFPFWKAVECNKNAFYVCINYGDAGCDKAISDRSICMDEDIAKVLKDVM